MFSTFLSISLLLESMPSMWADMLRIVELNSSIFVGYRMLICLSSSAKLGGSSLSILCSWSSNSVNAFVRWFEMTLWLFDRTSKLDVIIWCPFSSVSFSFLTVSKSSSIATLSTVSLSISLLIVSFSSESWPTLIIRESWPVLRAFFLLRDHLSKVNLQCLLLLGDSSQVCYHDFLRLLQRILLRDNLDKIRLDLVLLLGYLAQVFDQQVLCSLELILLTCQ